MNSAGVFSFFSGMGFLDLGFEMAGFPIEFVNEYSETYLKCYKYARENAPFSHVPQFGYHCCDARTFLVDESWKSAIPNWPDFLLTGFIGGPPCPDFSVAGRNAGFIGKNGQLTRVYFDLILKHKPDFFVFENVKGLYSTQKHRCNYLKIKSEMNKAGYTLFDSIENAIEYGAPQYRDRLILIGIKEKIVQERGPFVFGNHKCYSINEINQKPWPKEDKFAVDGFLERPPEIIEEITVEYWFRKNAVYLHPNSNDIFKVKNNDKYLSINEGHTSGKSFKRLHRWRYSPTAAYGNNEVHLHPYKMRRLSVAEALAIQSAPAFVSLPDTVALSTKFKIIGNAVPYLLAYGIACDLREYFIKDLEGEKQNGVSY